MKNKNDHHILIFRSVLIDCFIVWILVIPRCIQPTIACDSKCKIIYVWIHMSYRSNYIRLYDTVSQYQEDCGRYDDMMDMICTVYDKDM